MNLPAHDWDSEVNRREIHAAADRVYELVEQRRHEYRSKKWSSATPTLLEVEIAKAIGHLEQLIAAAEVRRELRSFTSVGV